MGAGNAASLDRALAALDLAEALSMRVNLASLLQSAVNALQRSLSGHWIVQGKTFTDAFTPTAYQAAVIDSAWKSAAGRTAPGMTRSIVGAATQAIQLGAEHGVPPKLVASFSVKHPDAVAYLDRVGANRVSQIDDATRDTIRRIVRNGLGQGTSYQDIARQIEERFREFGRPSPLGHIRSRAELVAVTETGDAYTAGTLIQAKRIQDLGFNVEKRWLTAGDAKVDDRICRNNERKGWLALDEVFPSGHAGPTGHPGCRCALQTRTLT